MCLPLERRMDNPNYDDVKDGVIFVVTSDPRLIYDRWGENAEVIEAIGVGIKIDSVKGSYVNKTFY